MNFTNNDLLKLERNYANLKGWNEFISNVPCFRTERPFPVRATGDGHIVRYEHITTDPMAPSLEELPTKIRQLINEIKTGKAPIKIQLHKRALNSSIVKKAEDYLKSKSLELVDKLDEIAIQQEVVNVTKQLLKNELPQSETKTQQFIRKCIKKELDELRSDIERFRNLETEYENKYKNFKQGVVDSLRSVLK